MLVLGFPALALGTNCYLLTPGEGEECLVVDPGIGVVDRLEEVLVGYRLRPAAVLLTHGHLDHIASITPVCGGHGVAAYVHADDAYRVADPVSGLGPELLAMFQQFSGGAAWREPDDVVRVGDGATLELAGLTVRVTHAPGHTEGSVMFGLDDVPAGLTEEAGELTRTVVAGDVLFAGSIGRTDLPGGNDADMERSLREQVLTLPDETLVLPGHGPATTIARERATNPYLRRLAPA